MRGVIAAGIVSAAVVACLPSAAGAAAETGVLEAAKGFRRLNDSTDMPQLVAALRARDADFRLGASAKMVA